MDHNKKASKDTVVARAGEHEFAHLIHNPYKCSSPAACRAPFCSPPTRNRSIAQQGGPQRVDSCVRQQSKPAYICRGCARAERFQIVAEIADWGLFGGEDGDRQLQRVGQQVHERARHDLCALVSPRCLRRRADVMIAIVSINREDGTANAHKPRSRLSDYVDMDVPAPAEQAPGPAAETPEAAARRRRFAELLEEFRHTAVLVPLGEADGPDRERGMLTADWNGVRFILAFSDGQALARYAQARGEFAREWMYQTVLGARLLDVAVQAAGVPCGVALDCADGTDGMVFPPVRGVVPDKAAVDFEAGGAA
ncbi:hypothetical protein [Streptomyces sp. NPDC054962]